jgi:hypothetical protein
MKRIIATMLLALALVITLPSHVSEADYIPDYSAPLTFSDEQLQQLSFKYLLRYFALRYETDPIPLLKTAWCESKHQMNRHNTTDPNGGSKGGLQFQQRTFDTYAKRIDIQNPDIWNKVHQAETGAYMFSIGEAKQWTTYMAIVNGGSYTFWYAPINDYYTVYCS